MAAHALFKLLEETQGPMEGAVALGLLEEYLRKLKAHLIDEDVKNDASLVVSTL